VPNQQVNDEQSIMFNSMHNVSQAIMALTGLDSLTLSTT